MRQIPLRQEFLWLAPFLCIALIAFGLFRPLPHFAPPAHSRTIMGSDGVQVQIALPFRGLSLVPAHCAACFLEETRSPDTVAYAGNFVARQRFAKDLMSQIYPEVLKKDSLWGSDLMHNSMSPFPELESLLAFDPGVYIGCRAPTALMRSIGLPVLTSGSTCGGKQKLMSCPGSPVPSRWSYYPEGPLFIPLLVEYDLIGHPELAEARIASYCQVISDLQHELEPSTLAYRPRVLMEGEYKGDFSRVGVVDAATERRIPGDDAERVLIMDPDMIFINGINTSPQQFMNDPQRKGLKAVWNRRVYKWEQGGITYKPAGIRWLAEIVHPERLLPKTRQLLRDRMMNEFDYRLSDEQIDKMLNVEENLGSAGAERFTSNYQTTNYQRSTK